MVALSAPKVDRLEAVFDFLKILERELSADFFHEGPWMIVHKIDPKTSFESLAEVSVQAAGCIGKQMLRGKQKDLIAWLRRVLSARSIVQLLHERSEGIRARALKRRRAGSKDASMAR